MSDPSLLMNDRTGRHLPPGCGSRTAYASHLRPGGHTRLSGHDLKGSTVLHTSAPRRVTRVMLVRALVGTLVAGLAASAFALSDGPAVARRGAAPGSAGIGDSYFPKDGNGGYDVGHYAVHDSYRFTSGRLSGHTVLSARATQNLSSFPLDLMLTPDAVTVDGRPARFRKASRHELV